MINYNFTSKNNNLWEDWVLHHDFEYNIENTQNQVNEIINNANISQEEFDQEIRNMNFDNLEKCIIRWKNNNLNLDKLWEWVLSRIYVPKTENDIALIKEILCVLKKYNLKFELNIDKILGGMDYNDLVSVSYQNEEITDFKKDSFTTISEILIIFNSNIYREQLSKIIIDVLEGIISKHNVRFDISLNDFIKNFETLNIHKYVDKKMLSLFFITKVVNELENNKEIHDIFVGFWEKHWFLDANLEKFVENSKFIHFDFFNIVKWYIDTENKNEYQEQYKIISELFSDKFEHFFWKINSTIFLNYFRLFEEDKQKANIYLENLNLFLDSIWNFNIWKDYSWWKSEHYFVRFFDNYMITENKNKYIDNIKEVYNQISNQDNSDLNWYLIDYYLNHLNQKERIFKIIQAIWNNTSYLK